MLSLVLAALAAYLLGSIPFGLLVARAWAGVDVRHHGSGNIGANNVLRTLGWMPAVTVALLDIAKGVAGTALGLWLGGDAGAALAAMGAVCGHNWPVFLKFRGGKGIATSAGALLILNHWVLLALAVLWVTAVAITRFASVGSLTTAVGAPVALALFHESTSVLAVGTILAVLAIWRHRSNIQRLLNGTETRFGHRVTVSNSRT